MNNLVRWQNPNGSALCGWTACPTGPGSSGGRRRRARSCEPCGKGERRRNVSLGVPRELERRNGIHRGEKKSLDGRKKIKSGSFSAVSKPNVASKYSSESSRRDLHNALLFTVYGIHNRALGKNEPGQNTPEKVKTRGH